MVMDFLFDINTSEVFVHLISADLIKCKAPEGLEGST
jgi:hypothetical protein